MWHWMRVSVRASHRGWKLATRVARMAIGVPDYEACVLRRDDDAAGTEPPLLFDLRSPPRVPRATPPPREAERERAELQG